MITIEHRHFVLILKYGVLWWLVTCIGGMGGPVEKKEGKEGEMGG